MLRASTGKSSQPDVWSTALAVWLNVLEGDDLETAYQLVRGLTTVANKDSIIIARMDKSASLSASPMKTAGPGAVDGLDNRLRTVSRSSGKLSARVLPLVSNARSALP